MQAKMNIAVVAKAPAEKLAEFVKRKNWQLNFLSSQNNTFNKDFVVETSAEVWIIRKSSSSDKCRALILSILQEMEGDGNKSYNFNSGWGAKVAQMPGVS